MCHFKWLLLFTKLCMKMSLQATRTPQARCNFLYVVIATRKDARTCVAVVTHRHSAKTCEFCQCHIYVACKIITERPCETFPLRPVIVATNKPLELACETTFLVLSYKLTDDVKFAGYTRQIKCIQNLY